MRSINVQEMLCAPKKFKNASSFIYLHYLQARKRQFNFYWHYFFWIVGMEHKIHTIPKRNNLIVHDDCCGCTTLVAASSEMCYYSIVIKVFIS